METCGCWATWTLQPPDPYYGDNSTTGMLYNGIWGYATGAREYALQCNSTGLHIIDVTDPLAPYRVQFINMSGGLNPPKGRIWRDVDIYTDPVSGKTYAYIGAQSNGDLWIVDLSFLSGSTAHGANSNPIPAAAIANRGRTNYGHTVSVHDGLGLLFMNTANNGSTLGCQIFDLRQDPFNPPVIASWSGSGHDCHDSFAQADVPGAGGKDLLYVADGYATRYRVVDISSVRYQAAARRSSALQQRCPGFTPTATGWTTTRTTCTRSRSSMRATSACMTSRIRRARRKSRRSSMPRTPRPTRASTTARCGASIC